MTAEPEPRGTDRPDDPILTAGQPIRDVLMRTAYYAWTLTGYASAPVARALAERRHNPHPGDLVIIGDAVHRADADDRHKGLGYYLAGRDEPSYTPELWESVREHYDDRPMPTEPVFYIQYGPNAGDVCRWSNASCMAIPHTRDVAKQIEGNAHRYH